MKDLLFIAYAGMIRGAVAFGLVLRIDNSIENRSVIVTSSLALVIVSTVFMGSTVSTVQRLLFGDLNKAEDTASQEHPDANESVHEMFLHPNFDAPAPGTTAPVPSSDSGKKKPLIRRMTDQVTRKVLPNGFVERLNRTCIYKYDPDKMYKSDELFKIAQVHTGKMKDHDDVEVPQNLPATEMRDMQTHNKAY